MKPQTTINYQDVLKLAVSEPGKIMAAYSAFHGYSFGNRLLAWAQCHERQLEMGPIATFKSWQSKGRNVKKGQKAIALFMPVTMSRTKENEDGEDVTTTFMRFTLKNNWFVLSQTDGDEIKTELSTPSWDRDLALQSLEIKLVPFDHGDGNVQGFASGRTVAINPLAQLPLKTLFHEVAHVLLGHTDREAHGSNTPRDIKEVEAESVALLCLATLGLDGQDYCRGYIQSWLKETEIPEESCRKIMSVADQILKSGQPKEVQS